MTERGIYWLVGDLLRQGASLEHVVERLHKRGASYEDLVEYIMINRENFLPTVES